MNWLYCFMMCLAGALSGVCTWLATPNAYHWNFSGNLQLVLVSASLLCAFFVAFAVAVPVAVIEKRFYKTLRYWLSGAVTGLPAALAATFMFYTVSRYLPQDSLQFCWWFYFSVVLAACFGYVHSDVKVMCRALVGLTPAMISGGSLADSLFKKGENNLASLVLIGVFTGLGLALAFDLLKDSWLDEEINNRIYYRYYIDSGDFLVGSASDCDLSINEGPRYLFKITEKRGVHTVEAFGSADKTAFTLNNRVIKYRALSDGDVITIGEVVLVYHTKFGRARNEMPAAVG